MPHSFLGRVKIRLQFTGWLQYIPTAILAAIFLLIAALLWLLGSEVAAYFPFLIGLLLLAISVFDIITVKLKLRPREHLPNKRNDDLEIFDLMRLRHSCRSFQNRKLTPEDYDELLEYVQSHSGLPNCALIGKRPIRIEYIDAPLTVWPVVGAQEFLVAIAPSEYDRLAVIDVGRCLQKIVMHATRMGLATCWIGPGADHDSIISHLGNRFNPTEDHIICVCAVGYKSKYIPLFVRLINFTLHRRLPLSSLFFMDSQFKEPLNANANPFKRFGRCYEICQWAPSSFNSQTTRCVGVLDRNCGKQGNSNEDEPRLVRFDFYQSTESRFYEPVALGIWCTNWEMGTEALGIKGYFSVLTIKERGENDEKTHSQLPRYDVSWIFE
jgi:nitroreductase